VLNELVHVHPEFGLKVDFSKEMNALIPNVVGIAQGKASLVRAPGPLGFGVVGVDWIGATNDAGIAVNESDVIRILFAGVFLLFLGAWLWKECHQCISLFGGVIHEGSESPG